MKFSNKACLGDFGVTSSDWEAAWELASERVWEDEQSNREPTDAEIESELEIVWDNQNKKE